MQLHPISFFRTHYRTILTAMAVLLLIGLYSHPVYDPDFWWHLKSGERIWTEKSLPEKDTLSFTTYEGITPEQEVRVSYILTSYWMSQPIFYLSWQMLGPEGVIALRTMLLLLSVSVLFLFLRQKGVSFSLAFCLSLLAGLHLADFTGERPQLFSFLFPVLYLFEAEALKGGSKRGIFTLPVMSIIWANMHSAALMSWLLGGFYLIEAAYNFFFVPGTKKTSRMVLVAVSAALLSSLLNPNTYLTFQLFFSVLKTKHTLLNTEYMSPITQFIELGKVHLAYWLLMLISGFMLFSRNIPLLRRGLLLALMLISLSGVRFTPFLVLLGPMLMADGLMVMTFRKGFSTALVIVAMTAISGFYLFQYRTELFSTGAAEGDYPKAAVSFIKEHPISNRVLNFIEWGGYLQWHLPSHQVFIDGRVLRLDTWDDYFFTAVNPDKRWNRVLERYRVGAILLPPVSPVHGEPLGILPLLLDSPEWKPVYADETAVIFVRKDATGEPIGRDVVIRQMITALRKWAKQDPENPLRWTRLAGLLYQEGRKEEALICYRKAYELQPDDPYLRNMVQLLGM